MKTIVKRNPILTDSDCKFLETAYKRFKKIEAKLDYPSDWAAEAIWQMGNNEGVPYFRHLLASQNHYYRKRTREMEKELRALHLGEHMLEHTLNDLKRSNPDEEDEAITRQQHQIAAGDVPDYDDSNDTGDTQRT